MVVCCVPSCGTDSWKCDGTITFYDFPTNPDLKAKWIKQINTIIKSNSLWFPRGRPVICSKHFLHTDFKNDTDSLKPRSIPTVFGHKYIGQNPEVTEDKLLKESNTKCSPVIVKFSRPQAPLVKNTPEVQVSGVASLSNSSNNVETNCELQVTELNSTLIDSSLNKNVSFVSKSTLPSPIKISHVSSNHINLKKPLSESTTNESTASGILQSNKNSYSILKRSPVKQSNVLPKKIAKKDSNSDLIEIGPNTFLKINPEVIKVNRKQTPSGNTVLQFVMDQKLAKNFNGDLIPKLVKNVPSSSEHNNDDATVTESFDSNKSTASTSQQNETVQHVLGHIVDNHVCEKSCIDLTLDEDEPMDVTQTSEAHTDASPKETTSNLAQGEKENAKDPAANGLNNSENENSCIEKAPVLLTTNMPLSHHFIDKAKYIMQLKQKNRQIAALKLKLSTLNKKIEELEDRCIVQERQLSYSFIKRLRNIRKNAAKGDPCATYILEQIRSYSYVNNSKMRWSDSTLTQCAIWCRKAPYAYEYFKKAGFFKLPCLGTVKRFMKKHPEIKFQKTVNKTTAEGEDNDESSSDFDFDESDGQNENGISEGENNESLSCETMLTDVAVSSAIGNSNVANQTKKENEIQTATESISISSENQNAQVMASDKTTCEIIDASNSIESNGIPVTVDTSNLELQEIMLPSGEVVQCYSSNIVGGTESGQYFIIPNVGDQNNPGNQEYNVVQAESMPVILQNIENSQLHMQQDQLIFIANSSDQVECSETEVTSV